MHAPPARRPMRRGLGSRQIIGHILPIAKAVMDADACRIRNGERYSLGTKGLDHAITDNE